MSGNTQEPGVIITLDDGGRKVPVAPGALIELRLPEIPGTAVVWQLPDIPGLDLVSDAYDDLSPGVGGSATRVLQFRLTKDAPIALHMVREKAFDPVVSRDAELQLEIEPTER